MFTTSTIFYLLTLFKYHTLRQFTLGSSVQLALGEGKDHNTAWQRSRGGIQKASLLK